MPSPLHTFISLDLPPLLAAIFVAIPCALLGNFLILRKLSLMGDAISHAVLPGIVVAFLISDSRAPTSMFLGALVAGLTTVALVGLIRRFTRIDSSAAIGVVFSILFALGVLLLEQAAARHVDLDADCVLMGQLETLWWSPPADWSALTDPAVLATFPAHVVAMGAVTLLVIAAVAIFFKELRLAAFDPALATSLGFNATALHVLLMVLVAVAAVAAFEAVGSILVVAMLICPAATARLLTDRLPAQLWASVAAALIAAVGGYALATRAPIWLGFDNALSAAGMIATASGALLTATIVLAPRHGILARQYRRLALAIRVAREDLLAALYRLEETTQTTNESRLDMIAAILNRSDLPARLARRAAIRRNQITPTPEPTLTPSGRALATEIIRSHRLWETYLVETVGLAPDHVHDTAMLLEHMRTPEGDRIIPAGAHTPESDPHGRAIPRKKPQDPANSDAP